MSEPRDDEMIPAMAVPDLGRRIWNPPGLRAISYRPGIYETFRLGMRLRLPRQRVPPDGDRPLAQLNLSDPLDWLLALVDAWAVAGDVLTFYLERIANEGYLRTAVEEDSVLYLLRSIDYAPLPAIAGSAPLAFTVVTGRRTSLPSEVEIPTRTQVRSLPTSSGTELPQVFELGASFAARSIWNAIRPLAAGLTAEPPLLAGATSIALDGTRTGLRAASPLLIVAAAGTQTFFRTLSDATTERAEGSASGGTGEGTLGGRGVTIASWEEPLPGAAGEAFVDPCAYGFAKRANLFGYNAVPWDQLPDNVKQTFSPRRGGVAVSTDRGAQLASADEGLPTTAVTALLFGDNGELVAATAAGVFYRERAAWKAPTSGLGRMAVQSLAWGERGQLYAGTSSGVYRSTDGGATWSYLAPPSLTRRRNQTAAPAAASGGGSGGSGGAVAKILAEILAQIRAFLAKIGSPSELTEPRLTSQQIPALAFVPGGSAGYLFAATPQGIYRAPANGGGWLPVNSGLPGYDAKTGFANLSVRALAAGPEGGGLLAASDRGLFRTTDLGANWRAAGLGYPRTKSGAAGASGVAVATDSRSRKTWVIAATDAGVFRSSDGGDRFAPASSGLPPPDAGALAAAAPVSGLAAALDRTTLTPLLYAAVGAALYLSEDLGGSWRALSLPDGSSSGSSNGSSGSSSGGSSTAITALAASDRSVAAATPFNGFVFDQYPGYRLQAGQIDLSTTFPDIQPGGWVSLFQSRPQPAPFPPLAPLVGSWQISAVETVARDDFGISGLITRLEVAADGADLSPFDLQTTAAYVASSPLPLAKLPVIEPIEGAQLELDIALADAPTGREIAVSGRRIRATLQPGAEPRNLEPPNDGQPVEVAPGDLLLILAAPTSDAAGLRWPVELASGIAGILVAKRAELLWKSAADDDPSVAEVVACLGAVPISRAGEPSETAPRTALTIDPALTRLYDPGTVSVSANVMTATQGETVPREILGNGNANRAQQRFTLRRQPLTYVPSSTGWSSTLEVFVNDIAWRQVTTLVGQGPASQVYVVERNTKGGATVIFGDGLNGSRLPTGVENVVARYRYGMWTAPQPAGALRLLQSRPLGLREVSNPLPSAGAIPPESSDDARETGPMTVRALDRIVSLDDYSDFAQTSPGVARAVASALRNGRSLIVALTVAGADGAPIDPGSEIYTTLSAAIRSRRYLAQPLQIASYERVGFSLAARVLPSPDADPSGLETAIRSALGTAFGFAAQGFGKGVSSSAVVAAIQGVPGVAAVELDALYPTGTEAKLQDTIPARPARVRKDGTIAPAELVLIDPAGIELHLEASS
ncbi:MAG TPA: putative baseplate assembly protein [Thermoanaerobaculia bacterium]|nr:putative baseplate assembly protein [Thermoanaerobaculia bacterium]